MTKLYRSPIQVELDNRQQPKALQQLRINLRRLRALLSFARPFLAEEEAAAWKQELGSWGRTLGSLRDVDVLAGHWRRMLLSPFGGMGGSRSRLEVTAEPSARTTKSPACTPALAAAEPSAKVSTSTPTAPSSPTGVR